MDYIKLKDTHFKESDFFVHLENLPEGIFHDDIKRFFVGLAIPDGSIKIYGRNNPKAFVAFSSPGTASVAILKNCSKIGSNPISVSYITPNGLHMKLLQNARRYLRFDDCLTGKTGTDVDSTRPLKRLRPTPTDEKCTFQSKLFAHDMKSGHGCYSLIPNRVVVTKRRKPRRKIARRIRPTRLPRTNHFD